VTLLQSSWIAEQDLARLLRGNAACKEERQTSMRNQEERQASSPQARLHSLQRTQLYSEELEIDLSEGSDREYFKWFLASLLFGGRITEGIAKNTYRALRRHRLLTPRSILDATWEYLVDPIMREGGYVRYDGRKSTQLLRDSEKLLNEYGGSLQRLHREATSPQDLEARLVEFHGVGPVTANIFLRELRPHWAKADPLPLPAVCQEAQELGIDLADFERKSMKFVRLEAGLLREHHERSLHRKRG
jgi:endonuclease III